MIDWLIDNTRRGCETFEEVELMQQNWQSQSKDGLGDKQTQVLDLSLMKNEFMSIKKTYSDL